MLKIPRKRLVRNVRLALGFAKTGSGRGCARLCDAQNYPLIHGKIVPPLDQLCGGIQKHDMGRIRNLRSARLLVIAMYALAAVSVGFAHKIATITSTSIELTAYILPDGSVPVICGDLGNYDVDHGSKHTSPVCDACRLVAAPGMVSANECWAPVRRPLSSLHARVTSDRVEIRRSSHVPHLRGPPEIG